MLLSFWINSGLAVLFLNLCLLFWSLLYLSLIVLPSLILSYNIHPLSINILKNLSQKVLLLNPCLTTQMLQYPQQTHYWLSTKQMLKMLQIILNDFCMTFQIWLPCSARCNGAVIYLARVHRGKSTPQLPEIAK